MIRMIVTDLDNTLLRRDKTISEHTVNVLNKCRERWVLLAFATARPMSQAAQFADAVKPDAMLLSNGAVIWANGEIVKEYALPGGRTNEMLRELAMSGKTYKISARGRSVYYTTDPNPLIAKAAPEPAILHDFTAPVPGELVHFSFRTKDEVFALEIINRFPEFQHFRVSGENLYDLGLLGVTKASGARFLAELFHVASADIAAFGDDFNDVEMLRECGVGVAVSNAIDALKEAADYVCDDCDEDGVAKWLEANAL